MHKVLSKSETAVPVVQNQESPLENTSDRLEAMDDDQVPSLGDVVGIYKEGFEMITPKKDPNAPPAERMTDESIDGSH